jgi:hypothetical protein
MEDWTAATLAVKQWECNKENGLLQFYDNTPARLRVELKRAPA